MYHRRGSLTFSSWVISKASTWGLATPGRSRIPSHSIPMSSRSSTTPARVRLKSSTPSSLARCCAMTYRKMGSSASSKPTLRGSSSGAGVFSSGVTTDGPPPQTSSPAAGGGCLLGFLLKMPIFPFFRQLTDRTGRDTGPSPQPARLRQAMSCRVPSGTPGSRSRS